jgi:hypothetical protein
MPKATAVWLVENTTLTFDQIAEFCGMHQLEVQAIADDEVAIGMRGLDPIASSQLTQEEVDRCQADPEARLELAKPKTPVPSARPKGARYTPVSKRQDRPDAIAWMVKNFPELSDPQISKLVGTTKPTINAVRDKTHWNTTNIKPQSPVGLGLCSEAELEKAIDVARARAGIVHAAQPTETAPAAPGGEEPAGAVPEAALTMPPEAPAAAPVEVPAEAPQAAPEPTAESVFGTPEPAADTEQQTADAESTPDTASETEVERP